MSPTVVAYPAVCPTCGGSTVTMSRCGNCGTWSCLECYTFHHCATREQFSDRPVLTCPASGCKLRRSDTQNLSQEVLDSICTGPDRPCFAGCFRSAPRAWAWTGTQLDE